MIHFSNKCKCFIKIMKEKGHFINLKQLSYSKLLIITCTELQKKLKIIKQMLHCAKYKVNKISNNWNFATAAKMKNLFSEKFIKAENIKLCQKSTPKYSFCSCVRLISGESEYNKSNKKIKMIYYSNSRLMDATALAASLC